MANYILTIDIGTTSTKAFAFLQTGDVIANCQKPYPTYYPKPGFAEQDPGEILSAVLESIASIITSVGENQMLSGICFSSAMHSLMGVDLKGKPITPLIIWADNRSENHATKIKATELGNEIYDRCGTPMHPMTPFCKIGWIQDVQPELFERVHKFISIKEYIFFHLTGQYVIDYSIASATGLFDTENLCWFEKALNSCGITPDSLSIPHPPEEKFFPLPEIAERLNIPVDTSLIIGSSDGCLANLGSKVTKPGEMTITIGTSGAVRMSVSQFRTDIHQRTFCYFLSPETFIVGGASNNGAVLLNWFSENVLLKSETAEVFLAEAFSVNSTEGLIFLPYLSGERAPIYDANAKGAYVGVGMNHKQAHFKRATIEGICFEIKSIVESVEEAVMPANKIFVSGGFIKSDRWVQLLSDIIGKPLCVDSNTDASSVGAAILAFKAVGVASYFQSQSPKIFYPKMTKHESYEKHYEVFKSLYLSLKSDFIKISQL